ncbi:AAA family ATPase [Ruminococcus sp.]|uniref:AAA family ATPase n=1 Tax=Ruminococcus sp. TaxID=41978 RepID=UPI0025FA0D7D|nr:AAA family ATPase [Ruminococcus sp.]MBR1430145.1 AAA family ATPase [Ruminococcus sp.]
MSLRDKMLSVIADVNAIVAEREELVEMIAIALLSRKNLFILGDPGQAKSYAINCFRSRITGARQFERLLSKQTDEEQLFGRIDLSSLIPGSLPESFFEDDDIYEAMKAELTEKVRDYSDETADEVAKLTQRLEAYKKAVAALHPSEPVVNTAGKIPESEICFLDEVFKANDGVLNSLLTALNERKYTNEGHTYPIPTISFFGASNEIPNFNDPQERILRALYDRLELKVVTKNIESRDERLRMLYNKQHSLSGQIAAAITLDELKLMQQEVADIPVPDAVNELCDDVLCELRKNGYKISDRKYLGYYPIAQARAWLRGHKEVESSDLLALKNYFWDKPSDIPLIETTLTRMCLNPMQDKVNEIRAAAKEVFDELNESEANGVDKLKAFRKFRGEMVHIYEMYTELKPKAAGDSEKTMLTELLNDLESQSRSAHEKAGYSYAPLEQIAAFK